MSPVDVKGSLNARSDLLPRLSFPPSLHICTPGYDTSLNSAMKATRPSLPRKCKKDRIGPRQPLQPRRSRATATPPRHDPAENAEAEERVRDGWRKVRGLLRFGNGIHAIYVQETWIGLKVAVSDVVEILAKTTVEWDTLDDDTQNKLTAWAPKAKEFLEHNLGSQGRLLYPFSLSGCLLT